MLKYLAENDINDHRFYSCIVPVDLSKLAQAVARFQKVETFKPSTRAQGKSVGNWISQQNRVKGKCFEAIMHVLLPNGTAFSSWTRVQTTTNEIDILVGLGPKSKWIRLFDNWGTHFICECKSEKGHFSVSWVDKLFAVLTLHSSHAGILVSRKTPSDKGNGRKALNAIRMMALKNKVIIVLDMEDIQRCVQGTHILALLQKRYIETTTGAANLALL